MKLRTLVLAIVLFITILGMGGQAQAVMTYSLPPDWMPMTMLSITFDPVTNKLAISSPSIAAPLATNTNMMGMPAPGIAVFDPAQPYAVLNSTAFSRRFGWWDANEMSSTPILSTVRAYYGAGANIWIQSVAQSPGFSTYQAIGANGLDMGNTYPGIFGTAGSSTKWQWDGMMDHNTNAVPFSYLTKPNQFFSAYYKIFIGDASGNELLVDINGSPVATAATTTTWGWQGPDFVFTSQTGVATSTSFESDIYTHAGASASISVTGGDYNISTDGGNNWLGWTNTPGTIKTNDKVKVNLLSSASAGATTTATLVIPTANGPGTFRVTTLGQITTPAAFSFTSQTGVATSALIESSSVTVSGINAATAISISAGGEYAVSTDSGATWGSWTNIAGTVANTNRVKVRQLSSANPGVTSTVTLTMGGVSGAFVLTTGNPVTPSLFFSPVTDAPANTSVSGMPFYVSSNAIAVTADSTISVTGGITPQYTVSTNGGVSWTAWSATNPATVANGNLVKVRVIPATASFTTSTTNLNLGSTVASFSVTTGYVNPPSWMPMAMLNVAFDSTTNILSVQDEATHPSFSSGALPALIYVQAGSYDPTKPWSVLNSGVAISRQLGWDDSTALHGNGITVPGSILYQIQAAYPGAGIWIERVSQSPGLETYFADGMYGVGGTGSGTSGTPQPYSNSTTGLPIIYANNYYGIFGTDGSSTTWRWDGTMIHNVYAVQSAYITQPNQLFTATYKVYIGDIDGNDIAPAAATTEVWTWKGPATVPDVVPDAFSFTSQIGVATSTVIESNSISVAGLTVPSVISITGGEYSVSIDGGSNWSIFSSISPAIVSNGNLLKAHQTSAANQGTTTTATLTIGSVAGTFDITTLDTVPGNFSFTNQVGVATTIVVESSPITVTGINTPVSISITGGEYSVSTDGGSIWSTYSSTAPAAVANGNQVKVRQTSSSLVYTTTITTLNLGGITGSFSVTTAPHIPENSYAVNATVSGTGGTIAPAGRIVKNGATTTFVVNHNYGYDVVVTSNCNDNGTLTGVNYKIGPITSNCTITASFSALPRELTFTTKPLVSPLSYSGKSGVLNFSVSGVTTQEELAASVHSSAPWIKPGSLTYNGNGKGTLKYTIDANVSVQVRVGDITIAGINYAFSQLAKPSKLSVLQSSTTPLSNTGGIIDVAVIIDPVDGGWSVSSVTWTPATPPEATNWLNGFTVNAVKTGSDILTLTGDANTSGKQRSAVLTLQSSDGKSKKTVTVKQSK
jgi:hypothetical protein